MRYVHVRSLEDYHPGYRDRELKWAKVYFKMVQGDPDFELIENEIDKWRFVAMICLELRAGKPLPDDEKYWKRIGCDLKERPMSKTLETLAPFLEFSELGETPEQQSPQSPQSPTAPNNEWFEEAWGLYPNKAGKKAAERHFKATVKTGDDYAQLKVALQNYLKSDRVKRGFIQDGSRWFNDWQSWITPAETLIGAKNNKVIVPTNALTFMPFLAEHGKQEGRDWRTENRDMVKKEVTYVAITDFDIVDLFKQYNRRR